MNPANETGLIEIGRFQAGARPCSYLPGETARLEYRILGNVPAEHYAFLLARGWRRFGLEYFRPACPACRKCRSIRIPVTEFVPNRAQRRCLKRNADVKVIIRSPSVSREHLEVYAAYHADMHQRRGWPVHPVDANQYAQSFILGDNGFAREFLYVRGRRLIGVALVDVVPTAISSVYFFHDPAWRPAAPGVFSVLQGVRYAQELGLQYQYLGYWIAECQSMAYKSQYRPHELLEEYPPDEAEPVWLRPDEELA